MWAGLDLQGSPQCRRKRTTVGRPSRLGSCSLSLEGARAPITGSGEIGMGGGSGVCHEAHDLGSVRFRFANGLEDPSDASAFRDFCFDDPIDDGNDGREMSPSPALRRAILVPIVVPNLLNMMDVVEIRGKGRQIGIE